MELSVSSSALGRVELGPGARYLDGDGLLSDLRGQNGTAMQSVAMGYVLGLLDADPCIAATLPAAGAARPNLEQVIARIEDWLAGNAEARPRAAAELVREALGPSSSDRGMQAQPATGSRRAATGRRQLRWVAVAVGATSLAVACVAFFVLGPPGGFDATVFDRNDALKAHAVRIAGLVLQERRFEKDVFINMGSRARIEDYVRKWNEARIRLQDEVGLAESLASSAEDRADLRRIASDLRIYADGYEAVLARIRTGQIVTPEQANTEFARYKDSVHRVETACTSLYERMAARDAERLRGST